MFMENKLLQYFFFFLKMLNSCFVSSASSRAFRNVVRSVCILLPGVIPSPEADFKAVSVIQLCLALGHIRFLIFFNQEEFINFLGVGRQRSASKVITSCPLQSPHGCNQIWSPSLFPVLNWCAPLLWVLNSDWGPPQATASWGCVK